VIGVVVFILGYAGAQTGIAFIPGLGHQFHIVEQIGGGALGITGLIWATSK